MQPVLEASGLAKRYGQLEAVRGIDFSVEPGEVFALIGPNGAGKTTTLRMVATILTPSAGELQVCGIDARKEPARVRERIAYLPEEAGVYKNLTGIAYLRFAAALFADDARERDAMVERGAEVSGLGERLRDKVGTYSKGMTRKLLLARAVMVRPDLAILDEPTSGLDVLNALEVRELVRGLAREGMAVLLSSHNMLEVEFLSDRVGIIANGRILASGTAEELKRAHGARNLEEVFARVATGGGAE
ncbi:ABC-type multidrug transport system, ATPase component [Coriobacteriaceae bacterium EMTCatB1]|nr:ABC-type multidrug transport system, ATPase component [Coriobacteriaceae bacterium EMTCatB1]